MSYEVGSISDYLVQYLLSEQYIRSVPTSGEYQIKKVRLDENKRFVITYDETAES